MGASSAQLIIQADRRLRGHSKLKPRSGVGLTQALGVMPKARAVVTFSLFFASCVALLCAHQVAEMMLKTYSASHIQSFGPRVSAFSLEIVGYMRNSAVICLGTLAISFGFAVLAWLRSATHDTKLGWIAIIGAFNYHVASIFVGAIAVGFFALPKLANGA